MVSRYTPEKFAQIQKELQELQKKCSRPDSMPKCTKSDRREIRKIEEELTYTMYTPEKHAEIIKHLNSLKAKCENVQNNNGQQQWPKENHYDHSNVRPIRGGHVYEHESGHSYENREYYVNGKKQPWNHKAEGFVGKTKNWLKDAKDSVFGKDHHFDETEDPEWSELTHEIQHFTEETNQRISKLQQHMNSIHQKRKHHTYEHDEQNHHREHQYYKPTTHPGRQRTYNEQQPQRRYYGAGGQMNI